LLNSITAAHSSAIEIAGVIAPPSDDADEALGNVLAPEALARERIHGVVVVGGNGHAIPTRLLLQCRIAGFQVLDEIGFLEQEAHRVDIDSPPCSWLFSASGVKAGEAKRRVFDLVLASVLLILTLPLMLLVALLIKLDSPGPAFYRQERIGLRGCRFTLLKFRSMRRDAEAGGVPIWAAVGDSRVTRIGRFMRLTRIDELPQLFNVLRGEMSFIGPRPERPYFVEQLSAAIPLYSVRHCVKPGITGWAQVKVPYGASLEDAREKLSYDLYYVKHRGWRLDLAILLRTLQVIVLGQGAR
jgi:exopolysaccharide biosynthesis polyprenyl glycosylphosphotransferase